MQTHRLTTLLVSTACVFHLTGCSSLGESFSGGGQTITIRSEPPQATVLADGTDIGTTPLTFKPADAFRSGFSSGKEGLLAYHYVGKLIVKKPGCKDFVTRVDDNILSKDIDVKLECDPNYRPPAPPAAVAPAVPATAAPATQPAMPASTAAPATQPAMPASTAAPAAQPAMPANAVERLQRIEALHDKGLISDSEYRDLRKRVLDTL